MVPGIWIQMHYETNIPLTALLEKAVNCLFAELLQALKEQHAVKYFGFCVTVELDEFANRIHMLLQASVT